VPLGFRWNVVLPPAGIPPPEAHKVQKGATCGNPLIWGQRSPNNLDVIAFLLYAE
jgi:hypothetical protein